jgi:hypothetical protein
MLVDHRDSTKTTNRDECAAKEAASGGSFADDSVYRRGGLVWLNDAEHDTMRALMRRTPLRERQRWL